MNIIAILAILELFICGAWGGIIFSKNRSKPPPSESGPDADTNSAAKQKDGTTNEFARRQRTNKNLTAFLEAQKYCKQLASSIRISAATKSNSASSSSKSGHGESSDKSLAKLLGPEDNSPPPPSSLPLCISGAKSKSAGSSSRQGELLATENNSPPPSSSLPLCFSGAASCGAVIKQRSRRTSSQKSLEAITEIDQNSSPTSSHSRFTDNAVPRESSTIDRSRRTQSHPSLGELLNARRKSEADSNSMDTLWEPMNNGIYLF
uniref:Uncharacterized protein n=1 Tax=Globodera rostochiensis TaxID=31243 RepID=A0A914HLU9_GLORO